MLFNRNYLERQRKFKNLMRYIRQLNAYATRSSNYLLSASFIYNLKESVSHYLMHNTLLALSMHTFKDWVCIFYYEKYCL